MKSCRQANDDTFPQIYFWTSNSQDLENSTVLCICDDGGVVCFKNFKVCYTNLVVLKHDYQSKTWNMFGGSLIPNSWLCYPFSAQVPSGSKQKRRQSRSLKPGSMARGPDGATELEISHPPNFLWKFKHHIYVNI